MNEQLQNAIAMYQARQDRTQHPAGKFDKAGRWHPSDAEQQTCCDSIRYPSRAYPYSYMTHCRTVEHIANLCGVDPKEPRRAVNAIRKAKKQAA
jgi:hypothetical protein